MSHTFSVALPAAPSREDVRRALPDDATFLEHDDDPPPGAMRDGEILAVARPGISTRPVELSWERGRFAARILACSCAEDYALALDAVCAIARGLEIEGEDGVRFAADGREPAAGRAWIAQHVATMVRMVLAQARTLEPEGDMTLPGPTRSFFLSAALAREIDGADDLFARMRAVMWPDEDELYAASPMRVTTKDGRSLTVVAWAPGIAYLFAPVDALSVMARDGEMIEVPWGALDEVAGPGRVEHLDARTRRVAAIGDGEWLEVVARARRRAIRLDDAARPGDPKLTPELRVLRTLSGISDDGEVPAEPPKASPLWLLGGLALGLLFVLWAWTKFDCG